jgi:bacteriocin biosynthesis cyclodehydratase domain-containing protein
MRDPAIPVRPAVSGRYHAEVIKGEVVAFVGENGSVLIRDTLAQHVVPLIDGRRNTAEIVQLLGPMAEPELTHHTIAGLARAGLVTEAADLPSPVSALWDEMGIPEFRVAALHDSVTIVIEALTQVAVSGLHAAFADLGLKVVSDPACASGVRVVVTDDYLDPRLADVDCRARDSGQPWLPVKPVGVNVWVGPMFVPGRTACWHCLAARLLRNRPIEDYLHRRKGRYVPLPINRARTRMAAEQAYAIAATQLARWLAHAQSDTAPALESTLVILETVPLVLSRHAVRRRPQCRGCGKPALAVPQAGVPALREQAMPIVSRDGGEHAEHAAATFARYAHLISPVTGVVAGVVASPWNGRSPIRSYVAGHNYALATDTLELVAEGLRTHSSGKGRSDAQACTSALCEALERLSGVFTGDEPRVHDSLEGLGDVALDPRQCMLFSERQYQERARWVATGSRFQMVPHAFDPSAPLDWSPLWSLTQQRVRYLPTSYLYFGYPYDEARFFAWADSNGNAGGRTLTQACLQGLYELVERDSVAIWWYNRIRRPRADLDGMSDPWISELREFYARCGREFWLLDLTTDLDIVTFVAINRRIGAPSEDIIMGFGAHHDPSIAASRALTEMNQFMPAVLDVDGDGMTAYQVHDRDAIRWWVTAHVANQPYLLPLQSESPTPLRSPHDGGLGDSTSRFDLAVKTLHARGFEVLVLDQTRPDLGLPVAKIIVPGLRHFWARFAPGRLFDVPVALNWIPEPTLEEQLNPIAMFL